MSVALERARMSLDVYSEADISSHEGLPFAEVMTEKTG